MQPDRLPDRIAQLISRGGSSIGALTEGLDVVSLWKWARLSLLVGAVAGLVAAGFFYALEWTEALLLYQLGGLEEPTFGAGEHLFDHTRPGPARWWLLAILPAIGSLIAGLLMWKFAPEAKGHGTDAMIDAYHFRRARIHPRVPLVKLVASLFTLGFGGSAGREGPTAQIGAGFGVFVAERLKLSQRERRLLLLAGAAAGISALFRAPLGAALWSLEVLYRDDFEAEGLFPCLVASVTGYSVFTTIYSQGSLFHVPVSYAFRPSQLVFYAALALACAPLGVLWIKLFYGTEHAFERFKAPAWLKPAIGGALLGVMTLALPWVYGAGYGWMQDALRPLADPTRQLPIGYAGFGLLLGVAIAKMMATSLTVGSGGSGGVFAPSLFIGGMIGGAFGLLFHEWAPDIVDQPGAFVLVGMGAFYAGVGHVPISTIILISELFGSYDLLVPLAFAEMITLLALRKFTLYQKQVPTALQSPAHVATFTVDVLQDLKVGDHYLQGRGSETVPASMPLSHFLERVAHTAESFFVVHDARGDLVGVLALSDVRAVISEQEFLQFVLVSDAMVPFRSVTPDTDLRTALHTFVESGYDYLPVVDPDTPTRVLGVLSQRGVFAAYNAEILRRRLSAEDRRRTEA